MEINTVDCLTKGAQPQTIIAKTMDRLAYGSMHTFTHFARRRAFEIALVVCVAQLAWLMLARAEPEAWGVLPSLRNTNFPHTHIGRIDLDLKGPNHWVRVEWRGPDAAGQDVGPFRSSPGAGWGTNDCNDPVESNCPDSRCTPKGVRKVEGFADHLKDSPVHRYVTWIDKRRAIGFHSCPAVEPFPASAGCVRLEPYAARLIHDNSIAGRTEIVIDGTWTNPRSAAGEWPQKGTKAHKEKIRGTLISANSH